MCIKSEKVVNIKARIRRNKLDKLAGNCYRDENSAIVKYLIEDSKKAILGIQREDGIYTILGENSIYYMASSGAEGEVSHSYFLEILSQNALSQGKAGDFAFVMVNSNDSVWLKDAGTMNAIWNTILLLSKR